MKHRFLSLVLLSAALSFTGCSTVSKMAANLSDKKKADELGRNPEQMRISTDAAIFQPVVRVDVPQFAGLQTPLVGGSRQRGSANDHSITLPRFTPVKVLSNNGRNALVQIASGQRGFIPAACIASESEILASAQPAIPVQPAANPQDLYVPQIDTGDAPVDQAMLNNIDSIPLPESEKHTPQHPEGQDVDGIVIRNPGTAVPTPAPAAPNTSAQAD
ncbi:MAG: hypothetical protein ABIT76_07975 [Chthoniobacterales bacterium]